MNKLAKTLAFSIFLFACIFSNSAHGATADDVLVSITPKNPRPFSGVAITLTSYSIDLDKATIEWRSGGKTVLSGTGKTKYSFTSGGPNTYTNFDITIIEEGASSPVIKNVSIGASDIDLLWEAVDSYTPPFYKGKALPSKGSRLKVVAFPNTSGLSQTNSKNIVYTWKSQYNVVKSASGAGKNKFTFTNSDIRNSEKISVSASGPGGVYTAEGTLNINIVNPQIIFYKKSPLEGVLYQNRLEDGGYVSEDEVTFVAEPYFLSFNNEQGGFLYNWKINGVSIDTPSNPRELTVRPSARGGYATIEFSLEDTKKLFQKVVNSLRIEL